jgi:hypothetical protein
VPFSFKIINIKLYRKLFSDDLDLLFFTIISINNTFCRGEAVCSLYTAKEGDRTMTLKRGQFVFVVVVVVIVIVVVLLFC